MAKKIVIPRLALTNVADAASPTARSRTVPGIKGGPETTYFICSVDAEVSADCRPHVYNLFPVVLNADNSPWAEANLFILSRLAAVPRPNMATYSGLAEDLAAFGQFVETCGLSFTDFPARKPHRPTYRYHADLKLRVQASELSLNTAKRRMSTVIRFYRWLESEGIAALEYPPWLESDRYLKFKTHQGFEVSKRVLTTDISIKSKVQADPYAETIDDSGKLRPLPPHEQEWLVESLLALKNTEMTLIHLVSWLTGARIQTVLTMRVRHVQLDLRPAIPEVRMAVGPGTGIDTKGDKNILLFLPVWLYEKLRTYSMSDRAQKRRLRAKGGDTDDQYLFLSQQGAPFYQAKDDPQRFGESSFLRHSKVGQGVRQFVTDRIIPSIRRRHDVKFHYRLHDLRATFGMNLTDAQLALVQRGEVTLHQAREFVKVRMGHESSATTDRYLNYRKDLRHLRAAILEYESYLKQLTQRAKEASL